jgi:hypothetical protein
MRVATSPFAAAEGIIRAEMPWENVFATESGEGAERRRLENAAAI